KDLVLAYNDKNTPASNITWKSIEEAQLKIIREALRIRYKKDSKLVTEYANYVKILRQEENPDEYLKSTAIMLFPNENAYEQRMKRPMTEDEISKTIEELIAYDDE
ncbi:18497_t:CDS:2, partial [Funneliformis geosporum]